MAGPASNCSAHALNRQIVQPPLMPAVPRRRVLAAGGTPLISLADRQDQPAAIDVFGADDAHVGPEDPLTHSFHVAEIGGGRGGPTRSHGERYHPRRDAKIRG